MLPEAARVASLLRFSNLDSYLEAARREVRETLDRLQSELQTLGRQPGQAGLSGPRSGTGEQGFYAGSAAGTPCLPLLLLDVGRER